MLKGTAMKSAKEGMNNSVGTGQPAEEDESNKTMSLMGGVVRAGELPEADLELQSMKPPNKLLSHGTLLIVAVFIVAAGSLYAMRFGAGDVKANVGDQVEKKIQDALARISTNTQTDSGKQLTPESLKELLGDTDDYLSIFSFDPTSRQVQVEFLKKNPFALPVFKSQVQEQKSDPDLAKLQKELEKKRMELKKEFDKLILQSIMQGPRPVAIINGELYKPGQALGSFVVQSILELSVVLEHEGETFVLEMKQEK